MTDAPLTPDQADEVASAYLDGQASPAEVARIEADPQLRARVEALERARAALQAAVPVDPARREAALASALAVAAEPGGVLAGDPSVPEAAVLARPRRWRAAPSPRRRYLTAAAAVAVAALALGLLSPLEGNDEGDTASVALDDEADASGSGDGERLDGAERDEATAGPERSSPGSGPVELGAFGELDDLVDAAGTRTDPTAWPTTTVGAAGAMTSTTLAGPCADQLVVPPDAEVLLEATATLDGEPVVVVVHQSPAGDRWLVVAARHDCRTLVDQAL